MPRIPRADAGLDCPLWHKPMEDVCHKCPWWMQLRGRNPNTGADVDDWGCAVGFLPMLLIENAMQIRGAAAATEDTRNVLVAAMAAGETANGHIGYTRCATKVISHDPVDTSRE